MFTMDAVRPASEDYKPPKILVYGPPGLGKTTFGCTFESPILLRAEDGACALDVATFPELVRTYADLCEAINALHGDHPFKTVVVDSLDWIEPLVWAETCVRLSNNSKSEIITSIEQPGYGKGYVEADKVWREMLAGMDSLRFNRGMQIVLIAHAEQKRVEPPDSDPYDRYQIKLHRRAWALWQEWVDALLFANYERRLIPTKSGGKDRPADKHRAEGSGERVLHTDERPAFLAKDRWGLPEKIYIGKDKTWSAFHNALAAATRGKYQPPTTANQEENAK
ncbi:MAG: ATP-binding protein [Desulfovibrio sp.]